MRMTGYRQGSNLVRGPQRQMLASSGSLQPICLPFSAKMPMGKAPMNCGNALDTHGDMR